MVKDPLTAASGILVKPLIDAEFRKAWMPFFCRSGHPVVTVDQYLGFVGHLLSQEPQFDLLSGEVVSSLLTFRALYNYLLLPTCENEIKCC